MNCQERVQEEIIIFSRYPEAGRTKTRLIPELGSRGAALLQRTMTEKIVRAARQAAGENCCRLSLYFTGGAQREMEQWLGQNLFYQRQIGADLGGRMRNAFLDAWERGAERVVLIGSDCPALDGRLIREALTALTARRFVLGPAVDGGYYLIGAARHLTETTLTKLLTNVAWGTSEVMRTTLARAADAGVNPAILKKLHDIDHPSDLEHLRHYSDL